MDKLILTKISKICIIFLFFIAIYFIFRYTFSILFPVFLVIFMATIMEPGVLLLHEKVKFPRPLASFIVLLSFVFLFIGVLTMMISEIYDGISYLSEHLPGQLHHVGIILEEFFNTSVLPVLDQLFQLFQRFADEHHTLPIQDSINGLFESFAALVSRFLQELLMGIPTILAIIPESLTIIFFILFAGFLLSADFPRVKHFLLQYIPGKISNRMHHIFFHLKKSTFGYFRAQLILVIVSFHLIFIGLFFIGVEHALTIAIFMIFIDLIPFLGTGLLFIPWIGYSFLSGDYPLTIGLSIVYGIVIITRQLIEPKIFSMNLAIHPLIWLFMAFIGWKIWGVIGLLVAPFLIIFLKGLYDAGVFRWMVDFVNGKS